MNKGLFKTIFRDKKLRLSRPRFLIFRGLSIAEHPLSPQELYQCLFEKQRMLSISFVS
jgi:Fe2+ or Zn2+ uptake regulation protein